MYQLPIRKSVSYTPLVERQEQEIKTEEQLATVGGYSERFSYEEWRSLINDLECCKQFKLKVRSSSSDDFKRVYAIESHETDTWRHTNRISFIMSDTKVIMDVMSDKDKFLEDFVACLMLEPLENMPLFINDSRELIKIVANWRLRNGI
jgi:hypothetical protein